MHGQEKGFTLIELLIVIAILGVLTLFVLNAIWNARDKAYDARIRNDIVQLRWLAESVFDSQGASYMNWTAHATIQQQLTLALSDIDKNYGDAAGAPYVTTIRDTQDGDYCVSAPLRGAVGKHYCVDATGVFKTTNSACAVSTGVPPLRCP